MYYPLIKHKECIVSYCSKPEKARGYCSKHYTQLLRYGRILSRTVYDLNKIVIFSNYAEIILYKGKTEQLEVARTKIDLCDIKKCSKHKWLLNAYGYAYCMKLRLSLHQLIIGKKDGFEIDHINMDTLDNRRKNLRFATRSQNSMNKNSKGYSFCNHYKKWRSYITVGYKTHNLGYFRTKNEAIDARINAENKYFKNFKNNNKKLCLTIH